MCEEECLLNKKTLKEEYHINSKTGFKFHYVSSETEVFKLHNHEFYEIMIIDKGNPIHVVSGGKTILKNNTLMLIRPNDTHEFFKDGKFYFANLAFSKTIANELFSYLTDFFPKDMLINSEQPPFVILSENEKAKIMNTISMINTIPAENTDEIRFRFKILIFDIFVKYLSAQRKNEKKQMPEWLEYTVEKMKEKDNFINGTEAMVRISSRTREHIARSMKKYCNCTISGFLDEIRLTYAANMLINSNLSVTDICYDSGYENLSWFYKKFRERYDCTPGEYRKMETIRTNKKDIITK